MEAPLAYCSGGNLGIWTKPFKKKKSEKKTPPSCYEIASQSVAGGTIDEATVVGDIIARCACEVEKRDLLGSNFPTKGEGCFCVGLWLGSISWGVDLQPQFSRLVMGMCQLAHEILAKYRAVISVGCKVCFFGFMSNEGLLIEVILVWLDEICN